MVGSNATAASMPPLPTQWPCAAAIVAASVGVAYRSKRLASALRAPVELDGHQRYVTASFGVRSADAATAEPEELLRDADAAMYRAKELAEARCEVFDASMHERAVERLDLEGGLRRAIEGDELRVLDQPQVEMVGGQIVGAEAHCAGSSPNAGSSSRRCSSRSPSRPASSSRSASGCSGRPAPRRQRGRSRPPGGSRSP